MYKQYDIKPCTLSKTVLYLTECLVVKARRSVVSNLNEKMGRRRRTIVVVFVVVVVVVIVIVGPSRGR